MTALAEELGISRVTLYRWVGSRGAHVGATHHIALLNHPTVYRHLREWLQRPAAMAELSRGTA